MNYCALVIPGAHSFPSAFSLKPKKSNSFSSVSQGMRCSPSYHLSVPPEVFLFLARISLFWRSQPRLGTPAVSSWVPSSGEHPLPWDWRLWSISVPGAHLAPSPQESTAGSRSAKISKMIHWDPLGLIRGVTPDKQKSFQGNAYILSRPFLTAASDAAAHQQGYCLPLGQPVSLLVTI